MAVEENPRWKGHNLASSFLRTQIIIRSSILTGICIGYIARGTWQRRPEVEGHDCGEKGDEIESFDFAVWSLVLKIALLTVRIRYFGWGSQTHMIQGKRWVLTAKDTRGNNSRVHFQVTAVRWQYPGRAVHTKAALTVGKGSYRPRMKWVMSNMFSGTKPGLQLPFFVGELHCLNDVLYIHVFVWYVQHGRQLGIVIALYCRECSTAVLPTFPGVWLPS